MALGNLKRRDCSLKKPIPPTAGGAQKKKRLYPFFAGEGFVKKARGKKPLLALVKNKKRKDAFGLLFLGFFH